MSFLVDPPLLVLSGAAIEAAVPDPVPRRVVEGAVVATFIGFSVGLYLEHPATLWLARLVGARSGRDWMINSRVTDLEYERPGALTHAVSAAIFTTYPLWARVGRRIGGAIRDDVQAHLAA